MYRTVWGTLRRTFREAKAICCKEPQRTNVSFCPKTFTMAEDPKVNSVQKDARKSWRSWKIYVKKWWGGPLQNLSETKGICTRRLQRSRNLGGTSVKPWRNLGGTFRETFWQPKTDLPQRARDSTQNLEKFCGTLVEPWGNLAGTLVEPFGSPRHIRHKKPETPRNLETLGETLVEPSAEPPKAIAVGEKFVERFVAAHVKFIHLISLGI